MSMYVSTHVCRGGCHTNTHRSEKKRERERDDECLLLLSLASLSLSDLIIIIFCFDFHGKYEHIHHHVDTISSSLMSRSIDRKLSFFSVLHLQPASFFLSIFLSLSLSPSLFCLFTIVVISPLSSLVFLHQNLSNPSEDAQEVDVKLNRLH